VALLLSYRLRFEPGARGTQPVAGSSAWVLLQLTIAGGTGLYRLSGQVMWPVRLVVAAAVGGGIGVLAAFGMGLGEGLSRQAMGIQVALFALGGALWRSVVGLGIRQQRRRELVEQFGSADLVVQGEDLASMTGGIARVHRHRCETPWSDLRLSYRDRCWGSPGPS
jgi:hypothetical protein